MEFAQISNLDVAVGASGKLPKSHFKYKRMATGHRIHKKNWRELPNLLRCGRCIFMGDKVVVTVSHWLRCDRPVTQPLIYGDHSSVPLFFVNSVHFSTSSAAATHYCTLEGGICILSLQYAT